MRKNVGQRYDDAVVRAKIALEGASSQLQRQVSSMIQCLDLTIQDLRRTFAKRAAAAIAQIAKEERDIDAIVNKAKASLVEARTHQAKVRKLGDPTLDEMASNVVKVSELQLKSLPKAGKSRITIIQAELRILGAFEEWMNKFGAAAVSSVFDGDDLGRAAALLSGLTIIAGVPGGPLVAGIFATAGATAVLVAELYKKSTRKKRTTIEGQTIVRYEGAGRLLSIAGEVFESWGRVMELRR